MKKFFLIMGAAIAPISFFATAALAEVYLTKEQALDVVFGKECVQSYEPKEIPQSLRDSLEKEKLWGEENTQAHFFTCSVNGKVTQYALIDAEIGKHLPITYIVGISPEGAVTRVEMMVFREIRGWEARERRFMKQFEQKTIEDKLAVGSSLQNVTGATLSSRAIAKGVKRALEMWQFFYKAQ